MNGIFSNKLPLLSENVKRDHRTLTHRVGYRAGDQHGSRQSKNLSRNNFFCNAINNCNLIHLFKILGILSKLAQLLQMLSIVISARIHMQENTPTVPVNEKNMLQMHSYEKPSKQLFAFWEGHSSSDTLRDAPFGLMHL